MRSCLRTPHIGWAPQSQRYRTRPECPYAGYATAPSPSVSPRVCDGSHHVLVAQLVEIHGVRAVLDAAHEVEEAARVGHRLTEVAELEDRVGGHQRARRAGHHQRAVRQLQSHLRRHGRRSVAVRQLRSHLRRHGRRSVAVRQLRSHLRRHGRRSVAVRQLRSHLRRHGRR